MPESAQASVAAPTHCINRKLVNAHLNESYSSFIKMNLPLVPLTQGSPMHILNSLPNEILRNIFEFLDKKDFAMAADSCTKYRSIAKEAISEQHSLIDEADISKMDRRTLVKFLRNFGACIESYVLNCGNMTYGCENRYLELFYHCFHVGDIALKDVGDIARKL